MKMLMRLDKTQVKSSFRWDTPQSGTKFNKNLAIMVGFKNYAAFIVGGGGGRSGDALSSFSNYKSRSNGGGGGGSLRLSGLLADLPLDSVIAVGDKGAYGANSPSDNVFAGHGMDGGNSSFNEHVAFGGKGGHGADYQSNGQYISTQGFGGDGGSNSAGLGAGGVGGLQQGKDPAGGNTPWSAATAGTYVVGGAYPVVGGGKGGGGGAGDVIEITGANGDPQPGGTGSSAAFEAPGQPPTFDGGHGGGANIAPFTGGAAEYRGCSASNMGNEYHPEGIVLLVLS